MNWRHPPAAHAAAAAATAAGVKLVLVEQRLVRVDLRLQRHLRLPRVGDVLRFCDHLHMQEARSQLTTRNMRIECIEAFASNMFDTKRQVCKSRILHDFDCLVRALAGNQCFA